MPQISPGPRGFYRPPRRRAAQAAMLVLALLAIGSSPAARASARAFAGAPAPAPVARASIVNGYVPDPNAWPWMAAVEFSASTAGNLPEDKRQFCGGTLIRPRVVLTAAHCVTESGIRTPTEIVVVVGRRFLTQATGEQLAVVSWVVHPKWNRRTFANDVAVLHLAAPSHFPPALVIDPRIQLKEGRRATVMGWGIQRDAAHAPGSKTLRAADVPLWSPQRCGRYISDYKASAEVCAGFLNGSVDSCAGDSGGPLMVLDAQGAWSLLGIVSHGIGCARPKLPGVYAWVNGPAIRPFIDQEAAMDTSPAPTAAPPIAGPPATAAGPDDTTPPRIGRLRLTGRRARLHARFSVSETSQVLVAIVSRRTERRVRRPIRRTVHSGANHITIGRALRPGRYLLVVRAFDGALNSSTRVVPFRVRAA